jgi:chemotaxis regulatin CheY-phosphate phosphatase CheZ
MTTINEKELDTILQKVSELKVFFDFGQRTLPLLDEVTGFVEQIGSAVDGMKALVQVTSDKIPKASEQLEKVNRASEQASNEILNTLDKMIATLEAMVEGDSGSIGPGDDIQKTAERVAQAVSELVEKAGWDLDIVRLSNIWDAHYQSLKGQKPSDEAKQKLQGLRDDCTNIMMALQVTDITEQQIAMVIGTIQAIADILKRLMDQLAMSLQVRPKTGEPAIPAAPEPTPAPQPEPETPGPTPEMVGADERKKLVESLLKKARSGDLLRGA